MKEISEGKFRTTINVAVARDYRNSDGIYDADFINCVLWNGVAAATKDYCHKGDVVGIKAKLQTHNYEAEDGTKRTMMEVVADKVIFITSPQAKKS